jgi:hypothetical protein
MAFGRGTMFMNVSAKHKIATPAGGQYEVTPAGWEAVLM